MSNFQLKGLNPYYRIQKGQAGYISNSVMTDEIAIEFLQKGDFESRLNLFSKYPDDVKELVQMPANLSEIVKGVDEDCCDDTEEPCAECKEAKRTELREMGIKDLKKAYPEVKYTPHLGMNKDAFIDLILQA